MAQTKFVAKSGIIQKIKGEVKGGQFDLNRMIQYIFNQNNVPFVDECCTDQADSAPVRFNSTTGELERHNGTDWVVVNEQLTRPDGTAVNATAAITAAQLAGGLITSTSAAAVTATLPTATLLATALSAEQGSIFDFVVDNSAGANTVTVAVNTGITAITPVITGGATLTVASGTVGVFKIIFTSTTAAKLARIV